MVFILLFFLSGFTGLVYEVVWVRLFTQVFGNTTYSVTAVLTAFMAGLAAGSWMFGRIADHRGRLLFTYALLETGVAVSAVIIPFIIPILDPVYSFLFNSIHFSGPLLTGARFILSFILMLVPTALMGGTLPVLVRYFVRHAGESGRKTGVLYGANTFGAAAGCFITGFYLIRGLGVKESVLAAAAVNIIIAACFFAADRYTRSASASAERPAAAKRTKDDNAPAGTRRAIFLALVAGSGFVSLSCEVLWTRLLVFKLKTTVYAFSAMLTVFLAGIAVGSVIYSALDRRFKLSGRAGTWGYLQWGISASCFMSIFVLGGFAEMPAAFTAVTTWTGTVINASLLPSLLVMAVPTLLMGMAFPAAAGIYTRQMKSLGASIGSLYAASTSGSILGSFLTGFLLVPVLGTQGTLTAVTVLGGIIATAALYMRQDAGAQPRAVSKWAMKALAEKLRPLAPWPVFIAAVALLPSGYLLRYYNIGEREHNSTAVIDHALEGVEGITTVHHFGDGNRVISTGSINVAGTAFTLRTTQKLQAHIPMLLHRNPKLVCQIGFGSGETSHIVTTYDIERLDLVEISAPVIDTSARCFSDINGGVVRHPRFNAIIMDGANYLRMTGKTYDVIMNDSIWPYYAGNSGLYTREYFHAAKNRLRPGGIMTSWVPVSMDLKSLIVLLKTFHAEFPYATVWYAASHENQHALIAGSLSPMSIDPAQFKKRFVAYARDDLREIGYSDTAAFLDICKLDGTAIDEMESPGVYHTENDPYLEFAVSRTTMHDLTNALTLITLYRGEAAALLGIGPSAGDALLRDLAKMYEATGHVLRGMILSSARNAACYSEFRRALALVPAYPGLSTAGIGIKPANPESAGNAGGNAGYGLLIDQAKQLISDGRFSTAIELLGKILKLYPRTGEACTLLGEAYLKIGYYGEAESALQNAIEFSPGNFEAYYHMGWIKLRRGYPGEAIPLFEKGIDRNPNAAELHYILGKAYTFINRLRPAAECFERAAELTPFDGELYLELGMIREQEGDYAGAIRYYGKTLKLVPEHGAARQRLEFVRSRSAH